VERAADEAAFPSYVALLAVGVTILSITGAILVKPPTSAGWLFAALPVLPLPLLALEATLLDVVELRSVYLQGLERQLSRAANRDIYGTPLPSFHRLSRQLWYGPRAFVAQAILLGAFGSLYVGDLIESYRAATARSAHGLALASTIGCAGAAALLLVLYLTKRISARRWNRYTVGAMRLIKVSERATTRDR
jgi:hypothetical protein